MKQSSCLDERRCLHLQLRHVNTDVAVKNYMTCKTPIDFDLDVLHLNSCSNP